MMSKEIKEKLKSLIAGEVLNDNKTLDDYSRDASLFEVRPELVIAPKNSADIQKLVSFVSKNPKLKLSITPRSGGTCMAGGPLTESIVLDVNKHLNHVKAVGNGYAITEPGVFYRDFEKLTLMKGQLMPSYPASREICTVGGMVGNNAGGEKTLSYGKTEDYVMEIKAVLADGKEYLIKPLTAKELKKKIAKKDIEGKIYKQVFDLIEKNYELIHGAKPAVSKNSSGYFLWNVWNRKTFDLTKLFTGSQGTLGIITEIKFRLIKPKPRSKMLVIFLKDLKVLGGIVNAVLEHKPETFESYDNNTLKLVFRFLPGMIKALKTNIFSLAWKFLPEAWTLLTYGIPKLILIAEFTGDNEKEVTDRARAAKKALKRLPVRTHLTRNPAEAKKYWVIRRESFNLLRHHVKNMRTAPFIDDLTVQPKLLPEFLPKLNEIMAQYKLTYTITGHVGDGNFHIIPLVKAGDPKNRKIYTELSEKVYDLVFQFRGSMSGEHNDGLIRSPFLEKMYGKKVYALFEKTKKIFDPKNIFNPGKKVGSSFKYAMDHLARS